MDLSVIIPCYNERDSLPELHLELTRVLSTLPHEYELIFVDDGSTDGSREILAGLAEADSHVRARSFVRNQGKSAAYMAGFEAASGALIATLDADLQDDPAEIPRLINRLEAGADLVVGWKQQRMGNEPLKAAPSRVFNRLKGFLFGLQLRDSNCGFRVMRWEVAASLELYGDQYRFIPELAFVKGFRVVEEGVHHRKRKHGQSKYGPKRFWTGLLDLLTVRFLTRYAQRPLHFFGTVGLVPMSLGVLLEFYVLSQKLMGEAFLQHVAAIIIGVLLLLVGFQCILTGLIGEMLTSHRKGPRPLLREESQTAHPSARKALEAHTSGGVQQPIHHLEHVDLRPGSGGNS